MQRWHSILIAILIIFSGRLDFAFAGKLAMNRLLPETNAIQSWNKNSKARIFKETRLYDYIDGAADLYLEFGFNQVITQEYVNGEKSIVLDIYEMKDAEAAFGIYAMFRDYQKPAAQIGGDATVFEYQVSFWQDCYYGIVMGYEDNDETRSTLLQFAQNAANRIASQKPEPLVLQKLPANGMIWRSCGAIKGLIALNNIFFLDKENVLCIDGINVKAAYASYQFDSDKGQLVLIQYPSPGVAEEKEMAVARIFSDKFSGVTPKLFKDAQGRFFALHAQNNLLYIFVKLSSESIIQKILGEG